MCYQYVLYKAVSCNQVTEFSPIKMYMYITCIKVSVVRVTEHNCFVFVPTLFKFFFEISLQITNLTYSMNLIIVFELFMLISVVVPKHSVPPKPLFEGKIESSSMQAEVGMY